MDRRSGRPDSPRCATKVAERRHPGLTYGRRTDHGAVSAEPKAKAITSCGDERPCREILAKEIARLRGMEHSVKHDHSIEIFVIGSCLRRRHQREEKQRTPGPVHVIPRFFTRGSFRNPGFWNPPSTKRDRHAGVSAILHGFSKMSRRPQSAPLQRRSRCGAEPYFSSQKWPMGRGCHATRVDGRPGRNLLRPGEAACGRRVIGAGGGALATFSGRPRTGPVALRGGRHGAATAPPARGPGTVRASGVGSAMASPPRGTTRTCDTKATCVP